MPPVYPLSRTDDLHRSHERRPPLKKAILFACAAAAFLGRRRAVAEALAASPDSLARHSLSPASAPLRSELAASRFVSDVDGAAALFVNPAGLAMRRISTALLQAPTGTTASRSSRSERRAENIGFGFTYTDDGLFTSRNYVLGLGAEARGGVERRFGVHVAPARASPARTAPRFTVDLGFMMRPAASSRSAASGRT